MSVDEPDLCKKFVNNISRNQDYLSLLNDKTDKCLLCTTQLQSGVNRTPVEGNDYFIDCDGTLAIRNGVCPRSLALSLITDVVVHRSKYIKLLGKNTLKFLLNLKQIVTKQQKVCPGENPLTFIRAESILKNFSFVEKEFDNLTNSGESEIIETLKMEEVSRSETVEKDIVSARLADTFINGSSNQLPVLENSTSEDNNLITILSQLTSNTSVHDHIYNSDGNVKSDNSDNGSTDSFSRVASPSSSMSSVYSGPTLTDKTREITSTKRGCKILPVASTDGQTHYLCPVCSLELSSDHELTIHIRSHNQSGQQNIPNTCTICGKTLSSQSSLDRHMLVHSGERPFKCKVCDMSFTTNGNMHRHARIHEKNGVLTPKAVGRKPLKHKSKEDVPSHENKSDSGSIVQIPQPISGSEYDKLDLPSNHLPEQNAFFHPYYRFMYPYSAAHHPAFPYPQFMNLPILQHVTQYINSLSRSVREPSPDLRVQQKLLCTVCEMVFSSQFALESHMETHVIVDEKLEAESTSTCKSCKTVAKSEASLLLHSLKYHKDEIETSEVNIKLNQKHSPSSPLIAAVHSNCSTNTNNIKNNAVGFENLGFANFTAKKFPLIAKVFCESYPSTRAVGLPVYKCKDCDLEFPVEGAKYLHEASHVPEEYTMCPKCNCHFSEPSRLQEHMQKHVSDLKFEESSDQIYLEHEKCHPMLQYHFLAQFDLTPKEANDQDLTKTDIEDVDNGIEDRSDSFYDDSTKVAHFEEDDNSELNHSRELSENSKEIKTDWMQNRMHLPTIIYDTKNCNNNTKPIPYLKASQKLSENNDILSSLSACNSNNTPAGSISVLNKHSLLRVSNGSVPQVLQCKHCSIVFTSTRALKYHLCTIKNTSQFQCKLCNYSSADKNTLLRHMRVHSGERPYKCLICEYSFTTKANCERHLRQKHGLEKNQLSDKLVCNKHIFSGKNKQYLDAISNRLNSSKTTGIDLSNWRFLQKDNSAANEQIDYTCKKCMKTFTSESSILQHISTHHSHNEQHKMEGLISSQNDGALNDLKLAHPSPPHAHLKSPLSSTMPVKCVVMDTIIAKQDLKGSLNGSPNDHYSMHMDAPLTEENVTYEANYEKPLDFSTQQKHIMSLSQKEDNQLIINAEIPLKENSEVVPIDLSIQKPLNTPALVATQDQSSNKKRSLCVLPSPAERPDKKAANPTTSDCDSPFVAKLHIDDCTHKNAVVFAKSPTESDSSCEFASINKILDVTDTQNFHNYLHIPETEDEQEIFISETSSSDEDSSISSEHMNVQSKYHPKTSIAANSALKKMANQSNIKITDAANMNEQAIAELIEKVSQENGLSPAKKKKNSYADSPHKFACPFCPRCFPWLSSLNRHLLTHTGQKPFKCPQCPVIFSTKSNRERHLIRKHNVNMLDPSSRSTMDRPYKCHICMFSSFSTNNNLMKHYKDKHSGSVAPSQIAGMDKLYDGGLEDILNGGGTSYEDEEEYNSLVEMQGGISDKDVMFENYTHDSDSNQSSNSSAFLCDAQTKKNNVLNFQINDSQKSTIKHPSNSCDLNMPIIKRICNAAEDIQLNESVKKLSKQDISKHTVENCSKSKITPAVECQKELFTNNENADGLSFQHLNSDQAMSPQKSYQKHQLNGLPFQCSFCSNSFNNRLECLQHLEQTHEQAWALIKDKNDIGNVEMFCTNLDKMFDQLSQNGVWGQSSDKSFSEQQNNLQKKSLGTNNCKPSLNNDGVNKPMVVPTALLAEQKDVNLDFTLEKQKLHKNGSDSNTMKEIIANDYLSNRICCALCPEMLKCLQDLKKHMKSHFDAAKSLNQLQTSVKSSKIISMSAQPSGHKVSKKKASTNVMYAEPNGNHTDMLHDLLGVESSTIDQILESSDSAVSLLGVYV